jgi:hypothetical protein
MAFMKTFMLFWRLPLFVFLSALMGGLPLLAQSASLQLADRGAPAAADSDHDGMSDAVEQRLLEQFEPRFMVAEDDCSVKPAEFKAGLKTPQVETDNGTIYGQVFPSAHGFPAMGTSGNGMTAEIHYYHLWRKDCGGHGHALDTEHVAVLVQSADPQSAATPWKALYWYAAAHENTVCDVSQIARASTLNAEDHGATVWVSPGKHASYLNKTLCQGGCGADRCGHMVPLAPPALINLGEPGFPMNGSTFIASTAWPLEAKMSASNFPQTQIARLEGLPSTDIAGFNPGRHPAQGIIARSSSTEQAIAGSGRDTGTAISLAEDSTGQSLAKAGGSTQNALSAAGGSTQRSLSRSYWHTVRALGVSARNVGKALQLSAKDQKNQAQKNQAQ